MCYWILPASGIPISHSTVTKISLEEHLQDAVCQVLIQMQEKLNTNIQNSQNFVDDNPIDLPIIKDNIHKKNAHQGMMTGITLPMTDTYKSRLYYQQEPSLSFARC
jgi:hypothetical protein